MFNAVICRKRLSIPSFKSELIDFAWVVIVLGQNKMHKTKKTLHDIHMRYSLGVHPNLPVLIGKLSDTNLNRMS